MKGNCKKLFVLGKIAAKSSELPTPSNMAKLLTTTHRLIESNLATVGMRHR